MDEFELLIAILRGIFKLIRFFFVSIFRLIRGTFRLLARAQSGNTVARAEPARSGLAPPPRSAIPAPALQPRPPIARPSFPSQDRSHPDWVPPPPSATVATRRRAVAKRSRAVAADDFLDPQSIREAIVLDAIMRRRGNR